MPRVVDVNGNTLASVDDELYQDFFFDTLMSDEAWYDVAGYLQDLKPTERLNLSRYIVERLAEVDPGHVPKKVNE